jgi:hypothetical protein
MIVLYIFSLVIFIAYVGAVLRRFGVPTSISESYYLWPSGRGQWLFNLFCLLVALPLMAFWFEISPPEWQFLVFFGCAPLGFVGAAGAFKEIDLTGRVHFIAAGLSAVASQAWIAINGPWWIISAVLLVAAVVMALKVPGRDAAGIRRSALLFWLELAAFISVYTALLAQYIL